MEIVGQLFVGWLLADLFSGFFHWWQDEFGKVSWPILGPWLIAPAQLHHAEPLVFTSNTFAERTRASIIAAALVGAVWWYVAGPSVMMFAFITGSALATEAHYYAHVPRNAGPVLRVFQEIGLIQSPKGHAVHHRPPQNRNYCALTDWLNPLFEALDFWRRLERVVRR